MGTKRRGRYVIVHRDHEDNVMQVSEPFHEESGAGVIAQQMLARINLFAGDKLCVEDEAGQAKEARNG